MVVSLSSSTSSFVCVDAVTVTKVAVVPSMVDGRGASSAGVVLLEMISILAAVELMLALVVPEETVDDDTVECNDVFGSVDTSVIAAVASDKLNWLNVTLLVDVTDRNVGVVIAVLFLDVTTFEHGKQFEMT